MDEAHQRHGELDDVLSLAQAARVSGISAHTLAQQAEKGRLRARKVGRTWITTQRWLGEYRLEHARRHGNGLRAAGGRREYDRDAGEGD